MSEQSELDFTGNRQDFVNRFSAIVTVEAVFAASGYPVMKLIALPLAGCEFLSGMIALATMLTKLAHQPLCYNEAQTGGDKVRLNI